ncbi:hypothetical protein GCM10007276_34620 [Agaricicola taiwanensis]|uniref:Putative Flp pilus-assembly TadG-like N-terminal domain-containing protein n=1 Tax=Agaricicola taiwanensis TaxID=591372 RepID=A0A8J2YMB9_9RHOB|nr:TadE/TadG family type IV pilus assembly protein [Agaricicola taiwanensis]GGE54666.1 hypothetical protein GCM10007276_34620 [Agaricicola taiwanensis]
MRMVRRAAEDTSGVVAVICGLAFVPLVLFIGFCIDFTNASRVETSLQATLDAGLLSVATNFQEFSSEGEMRRFEIDRRLMSFLQASGLPREVLDTIEVESTISTENVFATASATVPTYLMRIVGLDTMNVGVRAEVVAANDAPVEVALALDVTGSMVADMGTLRSGAQGFLDKVTGGRTNPNVKVGVVPFVAAVNIGNPTGRSSWIDLNANSAHHAMNLEGAWVAMKKIPGCYEQEGDGAIGGGSDGDSRGWIDLSHINGMVASVIGELFGIPDAAAANPYELRQVPASWSEDSHCYWMNPEKINNTRLFELLPGTSWKGCVEARPDPYDVDDTPPIAGRPNTLWVPYFWPDGIDAGVLWYNESSNNYLSDEPFHPDTNMADHGWGRFYSITKYRPDNKSVHIVETGPSVKGPNRACPEPLLPLTTRLQCHQFQDRQPPAL